MPGSTSDSVSVDSVSNEDTLSIMESIHSSPPPIAIEQMYQDLQLAHKHLQQELKRIQHEDFNARAKDEGQSHHNVSAQFLDMFRFSTAWARDYFKIPFGDFRIDEHELFAASLERVLCGGCQWPKKKKMNVSHLVQAVVADILAQRILLLQFVGCSPSTRHEFGQMYDAMLKENESRAYKWRASTFAAYERCQFWAPLDPSAAPEPTSSLRQAFYRAIADEIEDTVGPIARKHFPGRDDHAQRQQRAMHFVEAAGNLAATLSRQAAKLEIIDKAWFERSQTAFVCADDRMHGRFAEEDEDEEDGFQVDIILRPGFLKYGNDDGEDLEKYAVWIPAMLDLSEKGGFEDAQESMDIDTPGARPEQPRDVDIAPAAVPSLEAAPRALPEQLRDIDIAPAAVPSPEAAPRALPEQPRDADIAVPPPAAAVSIPAATPPPKPAAPHRSKPPHPRHHRDRVAKSTPRARACRAWKQRVSAALTRLLPCLCSRHCVFLITCVDALVHASSVYRAVR